MNNSLLYNRSAILRIKGIVYPRPVKLREMDKVIWVWIAGNRPEFISKKIFQEQFRKFRQEGSKGLKVTKVNPCIYHVVNPGKGSMYGVYLGSEVRCNCEDFKNQIEMDIKNPCCKHIYAVLDWNGFSSLEEYLKD